MKKYIQIFKISFEQEFVYKFNFVMWRLRNVFQILVAFFLWETIFSDPNKNVFGYDKQAIMTYVFGLMIVRSLVLSARAIDVSSDVSEGNLSNYLLKPVSYFKYWLTRDLSSKLLNLVFAIVEFSVLFLLLKPDFYFQTNPILLILFIVSILVAALIYFTILFIVSSVPFWAPELGWASQFLVAVVIIEFLSGALFPIDVLPTMLRNFVMMTPFPYMIYFPIQVYLGNFSSAMLFQHFVVSGVWLMILWVLMKHVWNKGLKVYQAIGR